jgi:SAM-dependent methyltransferase
MEHIPLVDATIREAARVLRPGGTFAYTVPVKSFNANLIGHRVLNAISSSLADRYARAVHNRLTHINVWPSQAWIEVTRAAGFDIDRAAVTVSPLATKAFEALLPAAYANRLWREATGHRPPHPEPFVKAAERVLLPLVRNQPTNGSNLFVVARKPV